jgi:glycosyltransferase involved in cell wall biosynthesis
MAQSSPLRIAIVHHWFVTQGGGERVAEVFAEMFPEADVFTLVWDPDFVPARIKDHKLTASILQRIPGAKRAHRHLMALYPFAVEQLDLTAYDLVITSDSGPMKGVITRPDAIQVCYCHSPMRYLWDSYHSYSSSMRGPVKWFFAIAAHYVRNWDYVAAQRVTHFLANSAHVAGRIQHYYGRASTVLHPPIDTSRGFIVSSPEDYYLAAGRLVSYKRTDLLIQACNRLNRRLQIVGAGPETRRLQAMAGPTIEFRGPLSTDELWRTYANCRALLFAAEEDFGMVPLEAQACGRPVIAFGRGGALETVRPYRNLHNSTSAREARSTGIFFPEQTVESLIQAISYFESIEGSFDPIAIQEHAQEFDTAIFREKMYEFVSPWYRPAIVNKLIPRAYCPVALGGDAFEHEASVVSAESEPE